MRNSPTLSLSLLFFLLVLSSAQAEEAKLYTLRYSFQPGEVLRWNVEHQSRVRTTVAKVTQTAVTHSSSVKAWRVSDVKEDGTATFEHLVESVDMSQKLDGSEEVRFNSLTNAKAPQGFEDVAASVGLPLSKITMDCHGKILNREHNKVRGSANSEGAITIPLPEEAIAVGHSWTFPCDIEIPLETGGMKSFKAVQCFKLEDVKTGVATISVSTEILTPVTDPALEAKLVQREGRGKIRFDIEAGHILSQQLDVDKHVVGFRGEVSSLHYNTRFTEAWMNASESAATEKAVQEAKVAFAAAEAKAKEAREAAAAATVEMEIPDASEATAKAASYEEAAGK